MGSLAVSVTVLFCLSILPSNSIARARSACPILSRFPLCKNYEILARTKDVNGCEQFECLACPLPRIGCDTNEKLLPTAVVGVDECPEFQCGRCDTLATAPRPKNCHVTKWKVEKDFNECISIICQDKDDNEKPIWN